MPAYLQRLLDTAAPASPDRVGLAPPISLTPVVRSDSPVLEQDQLLGLHEPSETEGEVPLATSPEPPPASAPRVPPRREAPTSPAEAVMRARPVPGIPEALVPTPVAEAVTDAPPTAVPSPPASRAARMLDPPPAPSDLPPMSEPAALPAVPVPVTPASLAETRPAEPVEHGDALQTPVVEAADAPPRRDPSPRLADPAAPADPATPDLPADRADPPAPVEAPPRIELSPRPRPEPIPEARHAEPPPVHAAPAQPTITIGHVTVEIVEEPRSTAPPPRPLTAASASVIGPLGQSRAAHRLLALRRL